MVIVILLVLLYGFVYALVDCSNYANVIGHNYAMLMAICCFKLGQCCWCCYHKSCWWLYVTIGAVQANFDGAVYAYVASWC